MTTTISDILATVVQRTSGSTSGLTSASDRASFQRGVRDDVANVLGQLNSIYKPLVTGLHDPVTPKTLDLGLSGNVIYTDITAVSGSADVYWFAAEARQYTIKETIDILLAKIASLDNDVTGIGVAVAFDDTDLWDSITIANANLSQVVADTFGGDYHLDGDGITNLLYSLAQHVDELGSFFTGFPGTGVTGYANVYPALALLGLDSPFSVTANVISNAPSSYTLDDFVFGSPTLNYDSDLAHASRFFYDKDLRAFRAGYQAGAKWDTANIGIDSIAMGNATQASATGSVSLGYANEIGIGADYAVISGGRNHNLFTSIGAAISGGGYNYIDTSTYAYVGGGYTNQILTSAYSGISYGSNNTVNAAGGYACANGKNALASHAGEVALAADMFVAQGDAQTSTIVMKRSTVVADGVTPKNLRDISGVEGWLFHINSTNLVEVSLVARSLSTPGKSIAWTGSAAFIMGATPATSTLLAGGPAQVVAGVGGAAAFTWQFLADTVNGGFYIEVTPTAAPAEDVQWVASVKITATHS